MKKWPVMTILFLLLWSLPLYTTTERFYREQTGNQVTTHHFIIENRSPAGYIINLETQTGTTLITQIFELDAQLGTISWSFHHHLDKTRLSAQRTENIILMIGTARGKEIKKKFKINDLPWNQSFNLGLEKFALQGEKKTKFWAIGTSGPGYMKITKFSVKKKKVETITFKTEQIPALHIQISLSGLLSMFWTGNYWYRQSNGMFLRYKGKNKPGAPVSIMELTLEKQRTD